MSATAAAMSTSDHGYKPPAGFEEDTKEALLDIPVNDSTELWLIQWPLKQLNPADFHGQDLNLKLHHNGQLGSVETSSGKSYDLVSYAAHEPDATVFLPSASGSKVVGKISRRVCLVRYPEPEELEKPSFYNPSISNMKSSSKKKSSRHDTLTSTHSVSRMSHEISQQSRKKRPKNNVPATTEASMKSNEQSHASGRESQVTSTSLGSEKSHGEKSKKKKKIKVEE